MKTQKCPLCEGRGFVPQGLQDKKYNKSEIELSEHLRHYEDCKVCGTLGILYYCDPNDVINFTFPVDETITETIPFEVIWNKMDTSKPFLANGKLEII
jgi:hypothetical protein